MSRKNQKTIEPIAISLSAAGAALGVCARTIFNEVRDGNLRTARIRNRRVVTIEALRDYVRRAQEGESVIET